MKVAKWLGERPLRFTHHAQDRFFERGCGNSGLIRTVRSGRLVGKQERERIIAAAVINGHGAPCADPRDLLVRASDSVFVVREDEGCVVVVTCWRLPAEALA